MESALNFIAANTLLEDDLRTYLYSTLKTFRPSKGTILVREGSIARTIGFIEKGIVRGFRKKDNGSDVTSFFMREGDVFISIRSFLEQLPAKETIQAMEPCIIHGIGYDQYRYAHKTFRHFDALRGDLLEKYYLLGEERDEMRQLKKKYDRFCFLLEHYPYLIDRVADKYLASFIDTTPEYFSNKKREYLRKNGHL